MEIGEHLTNVMSISDLSSIQYYYLEFPSTSSEPLRASLLEIEATWRQSGALVTSDRSGIWLFGKGNDAETFLPSTVTYESGGIIDYNGDKLAIKQQGSYEPSSLWKAARSLTVSSSTYNGPTSPAFSSDGSIRNAQVLNAKAAQNNATVGINKEAGVVPSPLKGESPVVEHAFAVRNIHEHFISAVLATLSYHLCHACGLVPLNARTLVLPPSVGSRNTEDFTQSAEGMLMGDRLLLVTLDVQLTSVGTLVAKAWPSVSLEFSCILGSGQNLGPPKPLAEGTILFLAPCGRNGRYRGPVMHWDHGITVDTVNSFREQSATGSPLPGHSITRWKQRCIRWLRNKGIKADTLQNGDWLMVQIVTQTCSVTSLDAGEEGLWTPEEKLVTMPWPARLCFQRKSSELVDTTASCLSRGYDPLSFAEGWFTAQANREAIMIKRQKERESAAAAVRAQAEIDARNLAPSNYSPVALRRASIAGAVYPTPPDGIPTIGATPSFDGNASSPGHPNPQSLLTEGENIAVRKGETDDADGNLWESNDAKRDPISSSLDFTDTGNDNLFGDMGGGLFDENDITDADFSFFDEPDTVEQAQDSEANDEPTFDFVKESGAVIDPRAIGDNPDDPTVSGLYSNVLMADINPDENHEMKDAPSPTYHAAQSNIDSNSVNELSMPPTYNHIVKDPSPPLSPEFVFKRLSTTGVVAGERMGSIALDRTVSAFKGVEFDPSLSAFNEKYGAHGRFIYPSTLKSFQQHSSAGLPKTEYLNKRRKRRSDVADLLNQVLVSPEEMLIPNLDNNDSQSDVESPSHSHITSPTSDQDDTSNATEDGLLMFPSGVKRKRGAEDADDDGGEEITASLQDLKMDNGHLLHASEPLEVLDPSLLDADPADWSLADFLSYPEPRIVTNALNDAEYIASAQILADQAISRNLLIPDIINTDATDVGAENCMDGFNIARVVQHNLAQAGKFCFDQVTECTMATFVDIQDIQPFGQISRIPPRPIANPRGLHPSDMGKPSAIFNLPAPHLEVRRSEFKLTVLPSAVPFWENLGFGPCKGGKDVSAICVYPDGAGMVENIDAFLDHTRSAYESSRLGTHERFSHADLVNGHVPMDFGDGATISVADHQAILSRIKETSTRLGGILSSGSVTETNIVIYYIYDLKSPELLVPICSAFHDLFRVYKDSLAEEKRPVSNELVLQLVPMHFVASHTSLIVPAPSEYARLAMEVYDRCVDLNLGTSVPSIVLEQPLPRGIDFKLTPNPSASPLQENSCMHVAYAKSIDDRWVTAAWTDNTGTRQMTASYCLGRRNAPLTTPFSDIAHEIWETTLEIIAARKVNWRVMVAKCGVMEPSEIDFWKTLAATESNAQVALTLICVDTNPSLRLLPPSISVSPNTLAAQSSFYTTPVSTPQASIVSPEQSGNASTPARESGPANAATPNDSNPELKIDADATLVDITDQTWGAVLSHRLNNSRSLLEFNPALISGYLIKRSGASPSDTPIVIEVNIVHSEANPRMYDALLREILGLYRGLATLARVRGCMDPAKDERPWHVAAAEKGVQVLYMLM